MDSDETSVSDFEDEVEEYVPEKKIYRKPRVTDEPVKKNKKSKSKTKTKTEKSNTKTNPIKKDLKKRRSTDATLSCNYCSALFVSEHGLRRHCTKYHSSTDANDALIKCDECECTYTSSHQFFRHKRQSHGGITLQCKYCSAKFKSTAGRRRHYKKFHNNHDVDPSDAISNLFNCDECNCTYTSAVQLRKHKIQSHDAPFFSCEKCEKQFISARTHKDHKCNVIVKSLQYDCKLCGCTFAEINELKLHLQVHEANGIADRSASNSITASQLIVPNPLYEPAVDGSARNDRTKVKRRICSKCHREFATKAEKRSHVCAGITNESPGGITTEIANLTSKKRHATESKHSANKRHRGK